MAGGETPHLAWNKLVFRHEQHFLQEKDVIGDEDIMQRRRMRVYQVQRNTYTLSQSIIMQSL